VGIGISEFKLTIGVLDCRSDKFKLSGFEISSIEDEIELLLRLMVLIIT